MDSDHLGGGLGEEQSTAMFNALFRDTPDEFDVAIGTSDATFQRCGHRAPPLWTFFHCHLNVGNIFVEAFLTITAAFCLRLFNGLKGWNFDGMTKGS